jgi:D-lyxose ketol-isomerase
MNINGRVSKMEQGERFAMEPGTKHSFTGEDGPCLLIEISMPSIRGDSFFDDHRIGKNGTL